LSYVKDFLQDLGTEALSRAIEQDISIWERLKARGLKLNQVKAFSGHYRDALMSADAQKTISALDKFAPEFAEVLRRNPEWLERELERLKGDLL